MVKFKAKIWKTGNGHVITIPAAIVGAEVDLGEEVIVDLERRSSFARRITPSLYNFPFRNQSGTTGENALLQSQLINMGEVLGGI